MKDLSPQQRVTGWWNRVWEGGGQITRRSSDDSRMNNFELREKFSLQQPMQTSVSGIIDDTLEYREQTGIDDSSAPLVLRANS